MTVSIWCVLLQVIGADCPGLQEGTKPPRCSSLILSLHRQTCETWDETDQNMLMKIGRLDSLDGGNCLYKPRLFSSCPDGSNKKTCRPQLDGSYICSCEQLTWSSTYRWDAEWSEMEGQVGLYRELCDPGKTICVDIQYIVSAVYLVKHTGLPDAMITASSDERAGCDAKRARIDNYYTYVGIDCCCWVASLSDPNKWLQFDLLQTFSVIGVLMRKRCDFMVQKVTQFAISYAEHSGSPWSFTNSGTVDACYASTRDQPSTISSFVHLFEQPILARYWRIHVIQYFRYPATKADIIGFPEE